MEYIRVTKDNLEKEHICCAISNNKDIQVLSKKAWLAGLMKGFCTTHVSARSTPSTFRWWHRPPRNMTSHSSRYKLRARKKHGMLQHLLRLMRYFTMGNI